MRIHCNTSSMKGESSKVECERLKVRIHVMYMVEMRPELQILPDDLDHAQV